MDPPMTTTMAHTLFFSVDIIMASRVVHYTNPDHIVSLTKPYRRGSAPPNGPRIIVLSKQLYTKGISQFIDSELI